MKRRSSSNPSIYRQVTLVAAALAALLAVGCSVSDVSDELELAPGRCRYNDDCREGHFCQRTYCQDIYFPRHKIKPY